MTRTLRITAGLLYCVNAGIVAGDAIVLTPFKDNTLIQQTDPSKQLSNGLGDIYVGRTNQDGSGPATISIRRGLIAFPINGHIPAGSTIISVTLTMRDVRGLNGDHATTLHRVSQDWGEGMSFFDGGQGNAATENDATWLYTFFNSADPAASPAWTTPGGDFSVTASASTIISDDEGDRQFVSWSSAMNPQMVVDVQDWLDNPAGNFGWLLLGGESAGQTAKRLNSGESTESPNVPPFLNITYVVPEPSGSTLALFSLIGFIVVTRLQSERSCRLM